MLEKCKNKPEFLTDLYGDPFDGEKVSQLTTSQGEDSESEVRYSEIKRGFYTVFIKYCELNQINIVL